MHDEGVPWRLFEAGQPLHQLAGSAVMRLIARSASAPVESDSALPCLDPP